MIYKEIARQFKRAGGNFMYVAMDKTLFSTMKDFWLRLSVNAP